jgi:hypothetical protein
MSEPPAAAMDKLVKAHAAADADDARRLRSLSTEERGRLIESACETAAVIYRSRLAAGLGEVEPAPWPASTWEFLRKWAARVRS